MTPERFEALAESYGADLRRWPQPERAAAERRLQGAREAAEVLARAGELDRALSAYGTAAPSLALQHRIAAQGLRRFSARRRLAKWLSGLGALGMLAGGAVAGAAVVALSGPAVPDWDGLDRLYEQSSFGAAAAPDDGRAGAVDPSPEI